MKFFKKKTKPLKAEELISKAKAIEPLVEELCMRLMHKYRSLLLANEITYIVPAVWGASPDGPLTAEQLRIHKMVQEVVDRVFEIIDFQDIDPRQRYAVGYLLRGLIISKIAYQIEGLRYHLMTMNAVPAVEEDGLSELETIGNA